MVDSEQRADRSRQLVVISGASSGIGLEVANYLSELGYTVLPGVRKQADADAVSAGAKFPDRMRPLVFDVTSDEQVQAAAASVSDLIGDGFTLRAVFSNAGIVAYSGDTSCEGTPIATLARLMEVNYLGAARFIQAFLPMLRASAGTVVVNSAMMAHTILPFSAGYAESKVALEAWADSLRREIRAMGVQVAILELAGIATDIESHSAAEPVKSQIYPGAAVIGDEMAAMTKHANDPKFSPRRVAELVARILETDHPKSRYIAGGGSRELQILGFMPNRVQDFVFAKMLARGIKK